ncbi:MAG: FliI/YscN family ATPase [Planctomycetota bacterium]
MNSSETDSIIGQLPVLPKSSDWNNAIKRLIPFQVQGRVCSLQGGVISVEGLPLAVGAVTRIERQGHGSLEAEVIGFENGRTLLAAFDALEGVRAGDRVELVQSCRSIKVSEELCGRVLDATGVPIDAGVPIGAGKRVFCDAPAVSPLSRQPIRSPLPTGVRAIDTLMSLGQGQRVGVFSAAGVGKSTLLGMLARGTQADFVVIGLIGERGREVRDFLENDLGHEGRAKSITVVATSDQPAPKRILAAKTATAIAETLRDQGKSVLLLMDSLTRFATAQREIGLAAGEAPTTRGYPTSVFSSLSHLVERAGNSARGSITAIYTILVEGDDNNEPISDAVRGFLDGHIVLSKSLADGGHYPAIDVLRSLSRLQQQLLDHNQTSVATEVRKWMAIYDEHRELIQIGAYRPGSNPQIDRAIAIKPTIDGFLKQSRNDIIEWNDAWEKIGHLIIR